MAKRVVLLSLWLAATLALSQLIHIGKTWSQAVSPLWLGCCGLGWLVVLGGSVFVLTLRMYALERRAGRVTRPVRVFERILESGANRG